MLPSCSSIVGLQVWLNGVDNADPFVLSYHGSNCTGAYGQCGWWEHPTPGPSCAAFFRQRCSDDEYGNVSLGVLRRGSPGLSIATLLLLRKEHGWFVADWWRGTSSTEPLLGSWVSVLLHFSLRSHGADRLFYSFAFVC